MPDMEMAPQEAAAETTAMVRSATRISPATSAWAAGLPAFAPGSSALTL